MQILLTTRHTSFFFFRIKTTPCPEPLMAYPLPLGKVLACCCSVPLLVGGFVRRPIHVWSADCAAPRNALAVWRVEKLAMTGFVAIGNGSLPGSAAGVEEVSTITVIQQLRTAVGQSDAQAKLLRIPGVGWDTQWADEARKESHAKKMASKQERAAQHLEMLQLQTARVCHVGGAAR